MDNFKSTSTSRQILLQDLGILLFIGSAAAGAIITAISGRALLYQHVFLLFSVFLIAVLITLRAKGTGTVCAAITLVVFTVYKLYRYFSFGEAIEWTAYLWPAIVLATLGGTYLFISLYSTIEGINGILNRRIDELTVMDPLTGLENLRSMMNALSRYMALSERNGTKMGLMLLRLRYASEIRKVISKQQFNDLRHMLAVSVQNTLRMEDRVFSIDENGSLGIIYFSEPNGAEIVKARLKSAIQGKVLLPDLNEQLLNVEVSVVYCNYDKEFGKDALRFFNEVEKEFAYEV